MSVSKKINQIPDDEKSALVLSLIEIIQFQQETIQALKDEVARLKGTNQKPKVPPSNLGKTKKKKGKGKKGKQAGYKDCVLNVDALAYMADRGLPKKILRSLAEHENTFLADEEAWSGFLKDLGITGPRHVQIAAEGALVGSLMEHGFNVDLVIISDDAGQFNVFLHALCWIHAERSVNKLTGFNEKQRRALENKKSEIWKLCEKLKKYKDNPTKLRKSFIEKRFDEIFLEKTDFATLNEALRRIHANKDELLLVLKRPDIPLHNNLSESDIRDYVKKRKISGSTRSPTGRKCRDTFASLKKTCRKQGVSFWEYLMDRLGGAKRRVPYLPDLIRGVCPKAS